jgi:hypothetical protein
LRLDQFQGPAGATGIIVRSAPPLDRPRVGPYDGAVALVDLAVAIVDLLATRVAERIPRRLRPVGSLRLFDLRHRELTIDEVRRGALRASEKADQFDAGQLYCAAQFLLDYLCTAI